MGDGGTIKVLFEERLSLIYTMGGFVPLQLFEENLVCNHKILQKNLKRKAEMSEIFIVEYRDSLKQLA